MTPESKVKAKVVALLKQYKVYYFFPVAGVFTRGGIPDIIACYQGRFIGIECKAGKNTCTKLQLMELENIRKAGGIALVIREDNIEELVNVLITRN